MNTSLRRLAKKHLMGNWGLAILATVIVNLVLNGPSLLLQLLINIAPMLVFAFSSLSLVSVFLMPMQLGLNRVFLDLSEQRNPNLDRVFYGFQRGQYPRNLGSLLLMGLLLVLWYMLLIIPGIIKTFSYAMTPYILADPKYDQVSASSAITISRRLMDGHKIELFLIQLYYTWWYGLLLGIGIAMIGMDIQPEASYGLIGVATALYTFYTLPLMTMVITEFYQRIKLGPNPTSSLTQTRDYDEEIQPQSPASSRDPLAWDTDEDPFSYEDPTVPEKQPSDDDDDPFYQ